MVNFCTVVYSLCFYVSFSYLFFVWMFEYTLLHYWFCSYTLLHNCNFLPLFFLLLYIYLSVIVTMANRNITLIKELDSMKDDYTLKVSIIRLWRSISDVNPNIIKSIEMILMDKMVKSAIPITLFFFIFNQFLFIKIQLFNII